MTKYYDIKELLKMKDINGNTPELFMAVSNRTAGKTYSISKYLLEKHFETKKEIGIYTLRKQDLGGVRVGIFNAVLTDHYPGYTISEKVAKNKSHSVIYLTYPVSEYVDGEDEEQFKTDILGYVFAISGAPKIKEISSKFINVDYMFMDEFQSDDVTKKDVENFIDIHMSVARGGGKASRYVPVIMASNAKSVNTPFLSALRISSRIRPDTHYIRGDGFILERFVNNSVADEQRKSSFNRAFAGSQILGSNIENEWLNDDYTGIAKPDASWGRGWYLRTIKNGDESYGVRNYNDVGIWYVSRSVDKSCPNVWALSIDGNENAPLIQCGSLFISIRNRFYAGNLRFSDLSLKGVLQDTILL